MKTIAIAGKGGTGKTTVAALVINWLSEHGGRPILAVDADSNVNLNDLLGVELKETVGGIREEMKVSADKLAAGMTKQQFLEYRIQASLVETPHFDLIAMGRPEGPGCYCYANNLLRDILSTLCSNYQYIVIDNEAGMEHLSRRTTQNIDHLLLVSDPSVRGVRAAGRISRLAEELHTSVRHEHLVLNRVQNSFAPRVEEAIKDDGLKLFHVIPEDAVLLELEEEGKSISSISVNSAAYRGVQHLLEKLLAGQEVTRHSDEF
jgi:CO dehydrogenase maturation factor